MTSVLQQITEVATIIIALAARRAGRHRDSDRHGAPKGTSDESTSSSSATHDDITPIVRNASRVSDNVNFITTAIRTDVDKMNATLHDRRTSGCSDAMALTEQQLSDFNALLTVVQRGGGAPVRLDGVDRAGSSAGRAGVSRVAVGWTLRLTSSMRPRRPTT